MARHFGIPSQQHEASLARARAEDRSFVVIMVALATLCAVFGILPAIGELLR